jgi:O-antigen/teichoic acid export membrane protein
VLYPNLQSIVFSATARIQDERERKAAVYLELLQGVSVLTLPAFAGVFFLARPLVLTIYGHAWAEAATYVATFSVMAPFLLIWGISTPFLWNSGRKSTEAKVQLPFIGIAAAAITLASQVSLPAVAWTAAALFISRTLLMVVLVARTLDITAAAVFRRAASALALALWVAAAAWSMQTVMTAASAPPVLRLLAGLAMLALALLAGLLVVPRLLPDTARSALRRGHQWPLLGALARRLSLRSDA